MLSFLKPAPDAKSKFQRIKFQPFISGVKLVFYCQSVLVTLAIMLFVLFSQPNRMTL